MNSRHPSNMNDEQPTGESAVSRRQFLKLTGAAGASVLAAGGMAAVLAACGGEEVTTTAAAPATTTTTAPPATSTTATSGSTVSTSAEAGREIRLGVVTPQTGPLAVFGIADKWSADLTRRTVGDGLVLGDGKKHPINLVFRDTQSDSNRAAQVAGDLITSDKIDILLAAGGPDTVNPAADQAEALGAPFLGLNDPWAAFVFGRGGSFDKPFKWTYGMLLGLEQMSAYMIEVFGKAQTNKKVAFLVPNNSDGLAWIDKNTGSPPVLEAAGYTVVVPSPFTPGAEDFTAQISQFKKEGCEALGGASTTPDFTNFWKQSLQQGFKPVVACQGLALGFPQAAHAMGPTVYGLIDPGGAWHPTFPFKDSLTGMTCQELADDYEKTMNSQWTGAIGGHAKTSWAIDVLGRAKNLDDKEAILGAIATTKLETIIGVCDMTQPVDKNPLDPAGTRPHPNVVKPILTAQQWIKGSKWPFEQVVVANHYAPMVPAVELQAMKYLSGVRAGRPGVTPSSPPACRPVLQRSARRYLVIEGTDMSRLLEFDSTKCTRDGVCVAVCPSRIIRLEDESPIPRVVADADSYCVKCGHCVAACPHSAVSHASMKPEDCPPVRPDLALDPDHVEHFLRSRRSIRSFEQRRVERQTLAKLIGIARYAPTGHNAQPVRWIAVDSPARVKEMAGITIDLLRSITDEGNPSELPAGALVKAWESGVDLVTRDAPALIVAYAPAGDPVAFADPILALSYLELAAPSFGLGACWNGFLMTAIHRWPPLSRALGLPEGDRALGVLILGYPAHKYLRLPTRRKPRIDWLE